MEIGDTLSGRYMLTDTIGQGGMANVFLARDLILERDVAVKVLRFDFMDNQDAIRRFQREAVSASQLLHHNIVEIYDVEEKEGQQYIVMEYVKGTDLKTYIRQNAPLSLDLAVSIMSQILSAIEVAHKHHIIHRDIKPQNILITDNKEVKITDFGIAIALSDTSITQTNTLLGSVHYLSPEQARGSNATQQTDIYALGVVLYELITGSVPYDGESAVSVALKHFQEAFPRIKDRLDYVPQSLENVVLRATAKEAAHRYANVQHMLADLSTSLSASRMNEAIYHPTGHNQESTVQAIKPIQSKQVVRETVANYREEVYDDVMPMNTPKKNRWFLKLLAFLFVLVALITGTYYFYTQATRYVNVPDVSNLPVAEATTLLEAAQLKVGTATQQWDDNVLQGNVIDTQPSSSARVEKNSTVDLVVSNGKEQVEIGNYVGSDYETIRSQLTDAGFIVTYQGFFTTDTESVGKILGQSQPAGSKVIPQQTTITFTVGTLSETSKMQDFYNLPVSMAQTFAEAYGLTLEVTYDYDDYIPEGQIMSQSPERGTQLVAGDTIAVVVSQGAEVVSELTATRIIPLEYIPLYAPSDKEQKNPLPNTIQVFIGDSRNSIKDVVQEFTITEAKEIKLILYIPSNGVGQYRIIQNGEVIDENNAVSPD
ncbi:MAG: Stk1 family PASTA domain-containing Ser/Thr kinase [Aerococcaceae bacterium]|nr:Stk1 family PASTA domain-containing Ser/Thr kinase [Aerococcaceae bacterium]